MGSPLRFEHLKKFNISSGKDLLFDGRYIWVLHGATISIIDPLQDSSIDSSIYVCQQTDNIVTLSAVKTHSLPFTGAQMIKVGVDTVAVTNNTNFTQIALVDFNAGHTSTLTTPDTSNSNLGYSNHKLWFVGNDITSWQNILRYYDLDTLSWGSTIIPLRHQTERYFVTQDYTSRVLITNFNHVSVARFNALNGAYIDNVRIEEIGVGANREPYFVWTSSDRISHIAGVNNLISTLDAATDTILHKYNGQDTVTSLQESNDQVYLWFTAGNDFFRLTKSNNNLLRNGSTEDYEISTDNFPSTDFLKLLIPDSYTYQTGYGSPEQYTTTEEQIWLMTSSHVIGIKPTEWVRRRGNNYSIEGQGMISKGPYDFTGGLGGTDPDPLGLGL